MKSTLRLAAAVGVIAFGVALASSPLSALEVQGFRGSALRAVSSLTEPGALLVWGTILAGCSHLFRRESSSD